MIFSDAMNVAHIRNVEGHTEMLHLNRDRKYYRKSRNFHLTDPRLRRTIVVIAAEFRTTERPDRGMDDGNGRSPGLRVSTACPAFPVSQWLE
jgi:hypothetical protein